MTRRKPENMKKKAGRKRVFNSPKELEEKAAKYFDICEKREEPPAMGEFAQFLGFADPQSMIDYEKRPEFSATIKKLKGQVKARVEKMALEGRVNPTFAIFWLKNFGWKDRVENDVSVNMLPSVKFDGAEVVFDVGE